MRIEYLGHSCFFISDNEKSVAFDPFGDIGYEQKRVKADFCVCSHFHFDHYATDYVDFKELITCENCKNYDFITEVSDFHDECGGIKRGKNSVFTVRFNDFTVCHMGDTGEPCNVELCRKIGQPDILLIPVGGVYTIDAKEAFKYVNEIKPHFVIPMHYKTQRSDIDVENKDEFLKLFDDSDILRKNEVFLLNDLPEKMKIIDISDVKF